VEVLLVKADLPRSPEVLLLAGLLRGAATSWVPSPEVVTCRLLSLWAWVAANGAPDSDSVDYLVPSEVVEALESQLGCSGLVAACCDPRVDWCAVRGGHVAFLRFAEWNGADAIRRRGDATRAKRSRARTRARMGRELSADTLGSGAELGPKTAPKAHANRDARHVLSAHDIDVDVDVSLKTLKKTSTSTSNETPPADPADVFRRIREAFRSPHDATAEQLAADRNTAWKSAAVVAELLGVDWLERVVTTAAKQSLRRPYAYLWNAVNRRLTELGRDARREFAKLTPPPDLAALDPLAEASARQAPPPPTKPRTSGPDPAIAAKYARRRELIAAGITGPELVEQLEAFTITGS
jgi:hypothetical protein